jgi:hypothetical protein
MTAELELAPCFFAHFSFAKILIPARQTSIIFSPAWLVEGVVDRDVG